jgi:hypothetical protein
MARCGRSPTLHPDAARVVAVMRVLQRLGSTRRGENTFRRAPGREFSPAAAGWALAQNLNFQGYCHIGMALGFVREGRWCKGDSKWRFGRRRLKAAKPLTSSTEEPR